MVDDKDIICLILLLFLFYVLFNQKAEGFNNLNFNQFNLQPLIGQITRKWNERPPIFYR